MSEYVTPTMTDLGKQPTPLTAMAIPLAIIPVLAACEAVVVVSAAVVEVAAVAEAVAVAAVVATTVADAVGKS